MGLVYAEIDLTSEEDIVLARLGLLPDERVKTVKIRALVDSGAWDLVITEEIQKQLNLPLVGKRLVEMADDTLMEVDLAGPLQVRFENRTTLVGSAVVMPTTCLVLLGAYPMEGLDVFIDPTGERLIVNPDAPDGPIRFLKRVSLSI
jgi:clan AA aspartic protease